MHAFGSDRVRPGRGEQWIIVAPRSKGWVPRTPARTVVATPQPGTAVLWEERYFEVVGVTSDATSVRYTLEPWRDEQVMRVVDGYDETSESRREQEHRDHQKREQNRRTATIASVFLGHLPSGVQQRLGNELGVVPARMTVLSLLLPMAVVATIVFIGVDRTVDQEGGISMFWWLLAIALVLESRARWSIAMSQDRGAGSVIGFLIYVVAWCFGPRRRWPSPFDDGSGTRRNRTSLP